MCLTNKPDLSHSATYLKLLKRSYRGDSKLKCQQNATTTAHYIWLLIQHLEKNIVSAASLIDWF